MQNFKNIIGKIVLVSMLVFISTNMYSRHVPVTGKANGGNPTPTAGCASATSIAEISLNNVRARVEGTGGSMWQDRPNNIADYEIPKRGNEDDPKFTSIYAGALWMGGQDVNGQLKIAAVTFRAGGNDFWPGPLDPGTADVEANVCNVFDQHFGISRSYVDQFVAWYQAGVDDAINGTTTQQDDYPGYIVPDEILNWPAWGNTVKKGVISYYVNHELAPFFDRDGDGLYDPTSGDYPKYDLLGDIDCRATRDVRLFGDTTIWYVFNDKGNTHTESFGPSIGMEIRAQTFAFATNDEVNNMTFYNYEMINRSTFTLTDTYFGQWVDADLGNSTDDYVGCDASRGLGYCYNGDNNDENANGITGYGATPPAVGVDFFEGPYADNDGIDNPLTQIVQDAIDSNGIPYKGLGLGYGDGIIDNERYGMKKFVYYNIGPGAFPGDGDPQSALDYYNYLRGRWRNGGAQMVWSGNGNGASTGGTVPADLIFPGDSDPLFWSTKGVPVTPAEWSELTADNGNPNPVGDRRFLESAGPFTLEPGAVNDLTVGVVWARATSGNQFASVGKLLVADDKAQALFDNCFKVSEGPDAPDVTFQEMENELILYLSNKKGLSNNSNEEYNQKDPFIAIPDTLDGVYQGSDEDKDTLKFYKFQGYQVFQVKNSSVTVSELYDVNVSRLAAQVDIKDNVTNLVNTYYNEEFNANVPGLMVEGADEGIRHSFRFTTDLFASGDNKLINHKTYYYIAIAYGYNEFKHYDPNDPLKLDGQRIPYISSRKMAGGAGITTFSAIPHNPAPEAGGTLANSEYGDQPMITRVEGKGNGGNNLELTSASEAAIVANKFYDYPTYKSGSGPIQVKVIDPLSVQAGTYRVQFRDTATFGQLIDAYWTLHLPNGDSINSNQTIAIENEQIFIDHGLSITIKQVDNPGVNKDLGSGVLTSSVEYADPSKPWLGGFSDGESANDQNWIRSGTAVLDVGSDASAYNDYDSPNFLDPEQDFEGIINGTWSPFRLVSYFKNNVITSEPTMEDFVGINVLGGAPIKNSKIKDINSVDIVFTNDQSKWTRCVVLEARNNTGLAEGGAKHLFLRESASVDKNGNDDGSGTTGLGWFPGYAINLETGQRLNMAFAEDSWLVGENGGDMKWNPTSTERAGINNELRMGGKHYVYVFKEDLPTYPIYDSCAVLYAKMSSGSLIDKLLSWQTCMWAGIPMLEQGRTLLETTAKVKLRVEKPFESYATASILNGGLPMYEFNTSGLEATLASDIAIDSALAMINVVPNPYYAYSEYETDQLDNRVKITNLPEEATISIYNVSGTLMRRFEKADPKTSLDWDLKNHVDIPVASGVYLIHVEVPNVGERTLKWFGVIKPTDLNGF